MNNIPDRLSIDKDDRDLYSEIKFFQGREAKEKFIFSMAIGFKNNIKYPLKAKEGFVLNKYLRPEDEALIYSIAIKHKQSPDVLLDLNEVYKIVEEYAHAGIKFLYDESFTKEFGSFINNFEKTIFDIYKQFALEDFKKEIS